MDEKTNEASDNVAFDKFCALLVDPDCFDFTNEDYARECRVTDRTIYRWRKKVDWAVVKADRRKKFDQAASRIDQALIRKAAEGDTKAIDLFYQRFDGWVPTSKQLTEHSLEDGLIDDEIKYLSDRRIATAGALADSARLDGEGRGPMAGPATGESEAKAG